MDEPELEPTAVDPAAPPAPATDPTPAPAGDAGAAAAAKPPAESEGWGKVTAELERFGQPAEAKPATDEPATTAEPTDKKEPPAAAPEAAKPAPEPKAPRFQVLGTDGKPVALALPEGVTIVFKASGAEQKVTSYDQLVELAQKGVDYDRQASDFGQRARAFEQQLDAARTEHQTALATQRRQFEDVMLSALFDQEAHKTLRKEFAHLRDPETRKLAERAAELDRREAADATRAAGERGKQYEETVGTFWTEARTQFTAALEQFPALSGDDFDVVANLWHKGYLDERDRLAPHMADVMREYQLDEPQARAAIERAAQQQLTLETLHAAMDRLNTRLGGKGRDPSDAAGTPPADPATRAASDQQDADTHNQRIHRKLEQRETRRELRGGGAPPGGSPAIPTPNTWDGHMGGISAEFAKMRTPARTS